MKASITAIHVDQGVDGTLINHLQHFTDEDAMGAIFRLRDIPAEKAGLRVRQPGMAQRRLSPVADREPCLPLRLAGTQA